MQYPLPPGQSHPQDEIKILKQNMFTFFAWKYGYIADRTYMYGYCLISHFVFCLRFFPNISKTCSLTMNLKESLLSCIQKEIFIIKLMFVHHELFSVQCISTREYSMMLSYDTRSQCCLLLSIKVTYIW